MAKIKMLSEDLIGKIAAGEVVERPAAAIQELVENSLDAGATRITVEIEEGGISSFRVTDDGSGIDESDIRMAFERHATSKIRSEADLDAIGTLGFRGEALASIAAVGRVTLTTRTRDRETGLRVKNEGGQIVDMTEAACAPGTSILVKELFFNVPVRKGFLKKPVTETNAITDLMTRLILSRPDVGFRYVSNGKMIYHSPGDGKIESAILAIYGSQVVRTMRKAEGHQGGVVIRGYVGIGENARNNRGGESFFINGRMMRSPLLSGALEDGCRERVMIGKFPICVLYLEMPYENVNVNVHPNKMEVRFRFDQQVRDAVYTIVKASLQDRDAFQRPVSMTLQEKQAPELPEIEVPKQSGIPQLPVSAQVEVGASVPAIKLREAPVTPVYRPIEGKEAFKPAAQEPIQPEPALPPLQLSHPPKAVPPVTETAEPIQEKQKTLSFDGPVSHVEEEQKSPWRNESSQEAFTAEVPPEASAAQVVQEDFLPADLPKPMKIFGAVFNTFILIEYADHLLMVDQHAVHERLLFERMMKAYEEDRAGQEMLVPYIVPVTQKDMAILEEYRDLLEEIGLTVEPFSANEVAIRSVPITLGQQESADFLHEAIDELENGRIPGADKKRAAILQQACKHAVKGGEPLTEDILRSLVEEMIEKKVTPTCPHGRPLVVSISHRELDKKFKRIQ